MKIEQQNTDQERTTRRHQMRMFKRMLRKHPESRGILLPALRAARIEEVLSQRDLAKMIGASQRTIRELESRRRGAYPKTIRRLSKALKLKPLWLTFHPESVVKMKGNYDE